MEWQQLQYFQTVANMQHISRAAVILSISQPALSRSISRLEAELGVPLFERQKRSIVLNQYGKLFLSRVNKIMQEFEEGKQEIQNLLDPEYGTISIGFLHTLGTHFVPDLIGAFKKKHPNIKFHLHQNNSQLLMEQLESGEIELCFSTYRETKLNVIWKELWREDLFLIVPDGHRLAAFKSVNLNQIAEESLICFKKSYTLRKITDQLCREAGFEPKVIFEGEEVTTIAGFVATGLGVAIIPIPKGLAQGKIARIKLKSPNSRRIINMACLNGKYLSPAVILFRQFVTDYFSSDKKYSGRQ